MEIESAVKTLMEKNRRVVNGHQFTVPASDIYPFQWLWDSCFHAIILSHFDIASAEKELLAAVAHPLASGLLPHMQYWNTNGEAIPNWGREARGADINKEWKSSGTSSITQPPVIAQATWRVYEAGKNLEFLRSVYAPMRQHFTYLAEERTFNVDSLVYIINPDESGEDNSPRFDAALALPHIQSANESLDKRISLMEKNSECDFVAKTCMSRFFGVADVSFNVLYAEDLLVMAKIAEVLGELTEAEEYSRLSSAVQWDILTLLRRGDLFLSYDHVNKRHIRTFTWNVFMPLYGGLLTDAEAQELVDTYLYNPDYFKSDFGIVTTAKTEAAYDPNDGFWRGPIWMAPHWFMYKGLKRYGFEVEANEIKAMTVGLLEQSGFREHYHPETGAGLGAKDFTWGGLVLDMD